jgi:hypothetical protein
MNGLQRNPFHLQTIAGDTGFSSDRQWLQPRNQNYEHV